MAGGIGVFLHFRCWRLRSRRRSKGSHPLGLLQKMSVGIKKRSSLESGSFWTRVCCKYQLFAKVLRATLDRQHMDSPCSRTADQGSLTPQCRLVVRYWGFPHTHTQFTVNVFAHLQKKSFTLNLPPPPHHGPWCYVNTALGESCVCRSPRIKTSTVKKQALK